VARYRIRGRGERLHERSRFIREQGRWFYVDAAPLEPTGKPSRA
jgi:SEC-C motif-containing protein